tara:strand:+ start:1042 stop:2220 length:1179 start_codon:yes stop_codon:yes gene_type:complete
MNFPKWPNYEEDEIKAVEKVLKSGNVNFWTGSVTKTFEEEFSKFCNCKFAIAVANGSLALSCAYLAVGVKKDDEVITTPRTFVATASSASLLGGIPIFAEVDKDSGNITVESIEPLINKKTKAIVVVHLAGWPVDLIRIAKLAKTYGIALIEDCSQAHGAGILINGEKLSVGQFGDISTWSFCQDKIISTGGEGGMVTTNNKNYFNKIRSFKDHGKSFSKLENREFNQGYKYIHDNLGSNFRITEMQSAIGRIQLCKLDLWTKIRTKNALLLYDILSKNPLVRAPLPGEDVVHGWYKFNCFINKDFLKDDWSRDKIINAIIEKGYPALQGSCSELYLEKCFLSKYSKLNKKLLIAHELGVTNLTFLVHPTINEEVMFNYASNILTIFNLACK